MRIVDSLFKRFCVFSVLCVQVPEFAAVDASWHHQVANTTHIYQFLIFTLFCPVNILVPVFRYMQNIWIYVYLAKYIDFLCTIRRLGSRIFGRVQQQQPTWLTFHPPSQSGPASLNLLPSLSTDDHDHGRHDPESSFSSWWSWVMDLLNSGRAQLAGCHSGLGISLGNISCHTFTPRAAAQVWNEQLGETLALSHCCLPVLLSTQEYLINWHKYGKISITPLMPASVLLN